MAQILPRDLPPVPGGVVNPGSANIVDTGAGVFQATPQQLVDSGAPINSKTDAEAGLVNTGRMTPLRVKQAIDALGVSQDVLASSSGGEMVGTKQTGSNKKDRTLTAKANDVLSLADFTGVDMTGATDSSTGFQNAIADGRALYIPDGVVKIDSDLVIAAASLGLVGSGKGSVLDFSGGGSLTIKSDPVRIADLASDLAGGGNVVAFATAHGLVKGDVFALWNPTDHSFGSSAWTTRPYYRDGRMFRVAKVNSTTEVVICGVLPMAYAAANFQCWKMTGGRVSLRNFRIIPSASTMIQMRIDGYQGVKLVDLVADDGTANTAIELTRCYDFNVSNANSTASASDAYPVTISNCQNGTVFNCTLYSIRHAVALGGRDVSANVPTADVLVSHCRLLNDATLGIGASDAHGCCDNITYSHCIMEAGASVGGRNISLLHNVIYGRPPALFADGLCITGSEIVGGIYRFVGNRLITWGNGVSFGIVNLAVKDRTEDFMLIDQDNIIESRSASAALRMLMIDVGTVAGSFRVDVRCKNKMFRGAGAHSAVMLSNTADISALGSVSVEGLDAPAGTLLMGASNSANYTMPLRMSPRQTGQVTLTCTTGTTAAISGYINFRYPFPRVPAAFCTGGGAIVGNRQAVGHVFAVENTRIRPMLHSGDETNWTATADRVASWAAGIEDF